MKLSIITINLNNYDGMKRTITSVVSQTFTDFEWLVIDGGSTDGSRELIEQYSSHFAYWCSEPDKGIYNAMNKGIAHAKGEWLFFLNSGDWLSDKNILSKVFQNNLIGDIVYGNIYETNGTNIVPLVLNKNLSFHTLYYKTIPHQSSFIKRDVLQKRPYNEKITIVSDWDFFIECALNGLIFNHIDYFISYYDTSGISSSNRKKLLKERAEVIEKKVPKCIQYDIERLEKYYTAYADGQLDAIDRIRNKNRFLHRLVTFELWVLKLFDKLCYNKKCRDNGE